MASPPNHDSDALERSDTVLEGSAPASAHGDEQAGTCALIAGRYAILGLVGRGGMGAVYRARDTELDDVVALKVLRSELGDSRQVVERFKREVKLARRVTHPNVARMYDIGEHMGIKFLTMEFIDGESLTDFIERSGRLSIPRVLDIACTICAGLAAAHQAGVVHRDLKPDNVMLTPAGRTVITDFGIARDPIAAGAGNTLGGVLGTPAYMAPEQVEANPDIDTRADIFAFGVVLFELLTGELPWRAPSVLALAGARLYAPAADVRGVRPDVPPALAAVIAKCLERDRERRFSDASDVASALAAAAGTSLREGAEMLMSTPPRPPTDALRQKTVAVLPFENLGAAEDGYVADGLTSELIDTLSMTQGLRVRPAGAVRRFRGGDVDPLKAGRELEVEVVVQGTIRRFGDRVRLSARLAGVADGFQIWAQRFDRPAHDLLVVSDETARAIADALTVHAVGPKHVAPTDAVAVDLYLRASAALRMQWPGEVTGAIELFRAAHERAPDDVAILAGFARASVRAWHFLGSADPQIGDDARTLTERAVQRAPDDPKVLVALATVRLMIGDARASAEAVKRAQLRGEHDPEVSEFVGRLLLEAGRPEQAIERLANVLELEPSQLTTRLDLARAYALIGDPNRALQILDDPESGGRESNVARLVVWSRLALWAPNAPPELEAIVVPEPVALGSAWDLVRIARDIASGVDVDDALRSATMHVSRGDRSPRLTALVRQILAEFSAYLGRHDAALAQIEAAVGVGLFDVTWLESCPLLADLRSDPRYAPLHAVVADRAKSVRNALGV